MDLVDKSAFNINVLSRNILLWIGTAYFTLFPKFKINDVTMSVSCHFD